MITPKQLRNAARFGQHLRPETLEWLADQVERLKKIDEVQVPDEPGRELAEKTRLLVEAREEGRQAGLREAKKIINNLTKNRTKEDFYPDAYDCRDAITRAAEEKNPPKEIDPNKWAFDRGLESY